MEDYWYEDAKCRGMDTSLFFLQRGETTPEAKRVKDVCKECPVIRQCLDFAIENKIQHGIFGGLAPKDRRKVRRSRLVINR